MVVVEPGVLDASGTKRPSAGAAGAVSEACEAPAAAAGVACGPGGCHHFLTRKRRYCHFEANPGSHFCGHHSQDLARKRVPCPVDPRHSCYADEVEKHLLRCPKVLQRRRDEQQPYFQPDLNAGEATAVGGGADPAAQHRPRPPALAALDSADDRFEHALALGTVAVRALIMQLHRVAEQLGIQEEFPASHRDACGEPVADLNAQTTRKSSQHASSKHGIQHRSIIGNMRVAGLLPPRPHTTYVDCGAGKGYLALALAEQAGVSRLLLNDVETFKLKADRCLRRVRGSEGSATRFLRCRVDLKDFNVAGALWALDGAAADATGAADTDAVAAADETGVPPLDGAATSAATPAGCVVGRAAGACSVKRWTAVRTPENAATDAGVEGRVGGPAGAAAIDARPGVCPPDGVQADELALAKRTTASTEGARVVDMQIGVCALDGCVCTMDAEAARRRDAGSAGASGGTICTGGRVLDGADTDVEARAANTDSRAAAAPGAIGWKEVHTGRVHAVAADGPLGIDQIERTGNAEQACQSCVDDAALRRPGAADGCTADASLGHERADGHAAACTPRASRHADAGPGAEATDSWDRRAGEGAGDSSSGTRRGSHPARPAGRYIGCGKHLCGAATDFALRGLVATASPSPDCQVAGICIATCCHHRCTWKAFVGKEAFEALGFEQRDFELFSWMAGWALCGHDAREDEGAAVEPTGAPAEPPGLGHKPFSSDSNCSAGCVHAQQENLTAGSAQRQRIESTAEALEVCPNHSEEQLSAAEAFPRGLRIQTGALCKRLIDICRLHWLQSQGLSGKIVCYVPAKISGENRLLVAS